MTASLDPRINRLLAALPPEEYDALAPRLTIVHLGTLEVIADAGEPLPYAYFPLGGIISIVALDADGGTVEVGTIGREGMAGLPAFLGLPGSPFQTAGQVPGYHARLPIGELLAAAVPGTILHILLLRFAQAFLVLAGQSSACNRLHPVEERCARWLLMSSNRVGATTFPITQEVLGQMLGVRRPSVTIAAGALQRAGLIAYRRGVVTILDRPGLEAATCECYRTIEHEFARLLGDLAPTGHTA